MSSPIHTTDAMLQQIVLAGICQSEVRPIAQHLTGCEYCRQRLEDFRLATESNPLSFGTRGCVIPAPIVSGHMPVESSR